MSVEKFASVWGGAFEGLNCCLEAMEEDCDESEYEWLIETLKGYIGCAEELKEKARAKDDDEKKYTLAQLRKAFGAGVHQAKNEATQSAGRASR